MTVQMASVTKSAGESSQHHVTTKNTNTMILKFTCNNPSAARSNKVKVKCS